MPTTRRTFLAATGATATAALAGCTGGGGGDGGGGGATATATDAENGTGNDTGTETADGAGATVRVSDHPELGELLVDGEGMTLYVFDNDTEGEMASSCNDDCAETWPPLTVDGEPTAGDGVTAELATFERDTGKTQVAAGGWPLYYFASDEASGDVNGQGANGVWWVLAPDGAPIRSEPSGGANETTTESDPDPY